MRDHTVSIDKSTTPASLTFSSNFNVAPSFIDRHLDEGRSDKIVIRSVAGDQVTYGELAEGVNRAGNALLGLGIGKGERVLMVVKDCPAFFFVFWGAIKAGIVPVPLNTLLRAKDYQFMIEDSGCVGLVYSPEFAGEVEPALEAASRRPDQVIRTEGDGQSLNAIMTAASDELEAAPASADEDCFWLYSSGTTGTPKGAVHAHRDMVETSEHYAVNMLGLKEDDVGFSAAKLFFAYGLGNGMTFPLWVGASTVLLPGPPTPDSTFDVIEKFKPSVYFGVPTLYGAQLKALESVERDLSSLRACVSAGEALPADIFRRWQEKTDTVILDGIGSTEALHIFISNVLGDYKPGTSGRVVPGYEAKIIDEARNEVAAGDSGRLLIRGGSTAKYYWNNPEKTAETMVDGWLDTGDTYIQDEDGYFHYCGRNDDMLKVGGIWCSPFEIEAKLIEHPKVLEAAVVGRADDENLIKPEAFVVLNDASEAGDDLSAELLLHCKEGLAKYKYPRWFNFVEDLPKTATGKIQRFKLR
ncbi:MAG: benzoate-CoA ligase family protein [Rhodospirillales bacterium]|nr:benzoate-CoA ligase family protein [Rhodospirillales bacterium]